MYGRISTAVPSPVSTGRQRGSHIRRCYGEDGMQQASRSIGSAEASNGNVFAPPPASPRFVVNLCSSTSPVGLTQPTHAGLKRFTFFVSRRLEEGRERFRLHMGYFDSQEEAEKMLDLVRDVYPAAWAGVAPGIKLRARAAQALGTSAAALAEAAATEAPATEAPAVGGASGRGHTRRSRSRSPGRDGPGCSAAARARSAA